MPSTRRTFSRQTRDAARFLGHQIAQARRERRWTLDDLAARAGVTPFTVRKVERGDPTVALGTAFEIAWLLGVPLFGSTEPGSLAGALRRSEDRLALLPTRVRPAPSKVPSGDF